MNNQASIFALLELLRECDSFAVTSHVRPDGDAIGSSLGLMHLLEGMGKHRDGSVHGSDPSELSLSAGRGTELEKASSGGCRDFS